MQKYTSYFAVLLFFMCGGNGGGGTPYFSGGSGIYFDPFWALERALAMKLFVLFNFCLYFI